MRRRTAMLLGAGVTVAVVAGVLGLSGLLAGERRAERAGYAQAMSLQRRAAGHLPPGSARAQGPARAPVELCVQGVETFASALAGSLPRAIVPAVVDDEGRLDMAAFTTVSDLAIQAQRYVEQATARPALPQRLGRSRVVPGPDDDGPDDGGEATSGWQPLVPARVPCAGGEAYVSARLDLEVPPAAAGATRAP
ncbi:hypothetical protein [Haliangium sp.]|uniref:hypothetical protein n=1 Tax=Haliangium sp. TaxID=2663208 RepID=UPI003D11BF47